MLTEEQQLVGKLDEVTGEGPPVTRQNVESPITEKLNPKEEPPSAAESLKQHGVSKRKPLDTPYLRDNTVYPKESAWHS